MGGQQKLHLTGRKHEVEWVEELGEGGEYGVLKELIKSYFKSFTAGPADCLTLKNCQSPHR